ncbi:MAG: potassium transporter TrkH [Rhodobacteraceae bacterium]|jgi:trk system potassium uptake protein TrkH|uniref:TrkH family potassium uptake protein n=1 Tax=Roseovarius sp. 10 TaxID=3080563 RepID=UPI001938D936|nr:TrkH family potassium uptake protein [Roseovarius sp. 10]MBE1290403.1 potassium transporter TrkH [Paracoccaceae bacterium]MDV7201172.1 TrkH family potassium uptake protein [Roseovarius sp. 10]QPI86248.1 TrkH family potassium uptake protein [Rhodobacterales bacterium HKCCA1288]
MFDIRPVGYVIGLIVTFLGVSMLVPMGVDLALANGEWGVFAESAAISVFIGLALVFSCANGVQQGLSLQQTFLLTTAIWAILPIFAALPFVFGATDARIVDAVFEAMSGLTTTGSTVFTGLEYLPHGLNLWRAMIQWFGGVGIIVVAMVFLPELRVGGMQIFRSEAFETMGKILPRATEIAARISVIYVALTFLCFLAYWALGMTFYNAIFHAFTTLSTGGFSNTDASFGVYQGPLEYVAAVFMILASLPFVRFVQLLAGTAEPLYRDSQVRAYLGVITALVLIMTVYRIVANGDHLEHGIREGLFNVTSIISGTGYSSVDYQLWGPLPVVVFFFVGLIGGCAGSTSCSIKIFRYQILLESISTQVRRLSAPHGVFEPRFEGRPVSADVLSSVMGFFVLFFVLLGIFAVALGLTGLDFVTSVSGAATALANIGPGLGDVIGPSGNFAPLNDAAKWILTLGMLLGRLELLAVLVLFMPAFWRG